MLDAASWSPIAPWKARPRPPPSAGGAPASGLSRFLSCECPEPAPLPETGQQVGRDVGLRTCAALSTGAELANPRCFRQEETALAKAQRRLSKAEQGTPERAERRKVAARVYARRRWRRGGVAAWRRGGVAAWRRGGVAAWRCGGVAAWRRGAFTHPHSRRMVNAFDLMVGEDRSVNRMVEDRSVNR